MKKLFTNETWSLGLAMFSMFFGAGNVIFPLAVGQYAGEKNLFAIFGLILTAVVMPIAGVIGMILYNGDYRQFFGRLGRWPGFLLALLIITLLGPLGSTPRCIALSYTALKSSFPTLMPIPFCACACLLIFVFAMKKNRMIGLLAYVLTPLLLLSLGLIIFLGITNGDSLPAVELSATAIFLHGLKEGYNTMDLLAAFFFSSAILSSLKSRKDPESSLQIAIGASILGAILLSIVYVGFSFLAAFHGGEFSLLNKDQLLEAIIKKVGGPQAGLLVCTTISLACLTTAIALISAFTDFIQREIYDIGYKNLLFIALGLTFIISTFEFNGISAFLGPILEMLYPVLITLTILNIILAYRKPITSSVK